MGLDGISVNQLRMVQENNSAEMNKILKNVSDEHRIVDSLSSGQKVNPDKEQEHQNPDFESDFESKDENESEEQNVEVAIKYDLSDSSKYILKVDEESNNILIIEKASDNVVQRISADELSNFVGFLSNSQGSIINRKF